MRLLDELLVSSIRKCIGCGHYFLHLTKREKEYCTSACAGKYIQREKRKKLESDRPKKRQFLLEQRFRIGEFRLGPAKYREHLKKHDKKALKSYEQWRKAKRFRKSVVKIAGN
jgi:hypothetical protein